MILNPINKILSSISDMRLLFRTMCLGLVVLLGCSVSMSGVANAPKTYSADFEKMVEVIKKYEGLHKNKGNLIGYGHKILPGEKYVRNQNLTESQADKLLRSDLTKLCERYRSFGKDSLLLTALAYNCGIGVVGKSSVLSKIKAGNRDFKDNYIAHSKYRGKILSQLKRRRLEEFELLYVE